MSKSKSYRKYAATTMAVAVASSAVAPVVAGAEDIEFTDVSKDSPHYDAIMKMAEQGILKGVTETEFAPYDEVYRLQVAKMLQRALNLGVPSNAEQLVRSYTDIGKDNYTQEDREAIAAVTAVGIFEGDAEGRFNAWEPINREQMASVLVRAFGLDQFEAEEEVDINLSNVDINHKNNVQILANLKLTDALDDYRPAETTLREQFASFLHRVFEEVEDAGFKVSDVIGLDDYNRYLEISFNQQVTSLEPSNIKIVDTKSGERYGVKEVDLASDGLSAQVELYAHEGADKHVLKNNRDYTVTVNANGQVSEFIFNRPAFLDARVIDIDVADREITVNDAGNERTFKVPEDIEDFDFQNVLAETTYIWYDEDNFVVDYRVADESAKYDAIEITKKDEIKLLSEDKKYKLTNEEDKVDFYIDGESVSLDDENGKLRFSEDYIDEKYNFAKVGFDKSGNVEYVGVYQLKNFLIVDKVEDDVIVGISGTGAEGEFDADDATIIKDNKVISLDDLEKGDILFFNEDANDGDGFAEVYNNGVTGEIDEVYRDSVEINGEIFNFEIDDEKYEQNINYNTAVYQKENGDLDQIDYKAAEKLQKAGEVTVFVDRAGNPIFFSGELADVQSDTKASFVVEASFDKSFDDAVARFEVVTQDGDEELHQLLLKDLNTISFNGQEFDIKTNPDDDEVKIDLENGNDPVVLLGGENKIVNLKEFFSENDESKLVQLVYNDSGNVTGLELFSDSDFNNIDEATEGFKSVEKDELEAGDKYASGYKLLSDTVVFNATDAFENGEYKENFDADDISVTTWEENGSDIESYDLIYNEDDEVIALVIKETTVSDEKYEGTVVTDVLRNTDNDVVRIKVFVNGNEEWLDVDKVRSDVEKGQPVVLEFSKNNKELVKGIATDHDRIEPISETIERSHIDTGKGTVKANDKTYRLVSDGQVIDASDKNDITTESLTKLADRDDVIAILDEDNSNFVKYFVYGLGTDSDNDEESDKSREFTITFNLDSVNESEKNQLLTDIAEKLKEDSGITEAEAEVENEQIKVKVDEDFISGEIKVTVEGYEEIVINVSEDDDGKLKVDDEVEVTPEDSEDGED